MSNQFYSNYHCYTVDVIDKNIDDYYDYQSINKFAKIHNYL